MRYSNRPRPWEARGSQVVRPKTDFWKGTPLFFLVSGLALGCWGVEENSLTLIHIGNGLIGLGFLVLLVKTFIQPVEDTSFVLVMKRLGFTVLTLLFGVCLVYNAQLTVPVYKVLSFIWDITTTHHHY
jgi:hypothetical protein